MSEHFEFTNPLLRWLLLGGKIEKPLYPPAHVLSYQAGETYVLHVAHPKGSLLVTGTGGFRRGALDELQAHTVFLAIGDLASQTDDYREDLWEETVDAVHARRVIPIHWDSLTDPITGDFLGQPHLLPWQDDEATRKFLHSKQSKDLEIETLPRYEPVVLFPSSPQ